MKIKNTFLIGRILLLIYFAIFIVLGIYFDRTVVIVASIFGIIIFVILSIIDYQDYKEILNKHKYGKN